MFTETSLLALLGGVAGLLMAAWVSPGLVESTKLGSGVPIRLDFSFDAQVFLYALAAVVFTAILVGMWPALRAARADVSTVLHEGGRSDQAGTGRHRMRNILVVAQVAGSLMLLIVAGLFIRSLERAQKVSLGFNPDHVLNLSVDVGQIGYKEARGREVYREIESRIRALPGVESVSQAFTVPMSVLSAGDRVWIKDHPLAAGEQPADLSYNQISSGYLDTLQIPLLRGRKFTDADSEKAPAVAIINQYMAQKFWPNEDALGRRLSVKGPSGPFIEVVGIVQDGKYQNVTEDPQPYFYVPLEQSYQSIRTFHVRASVPPETLALQIESQIQELAPNVPITQVQTMTQSLQGANGFFFFRFGAQLAAVMGGLGLILAIVGIYSVVAYAAAQRTQEIGIRIAMGAAPRDILIMVLRQGLGVVGIGMGLGLLLALAGTRLMGGLIVGVKPTDPLTFTVVVALLTGIALFACWIPARRATRIDPLVALRYE